MNDVRIRKWIVAHAHKRHMRQLLPKGHQNWNSYEPSGRRRAKAPPKRGLRCNAVVPAVYASCAAFATSASFANDAGSFTAMSERTLRSRVTSAFFRPFMNTE